jgi:hypothetical protein
VFSLNAALEIAFPNESRLFTVVQPYMVEPGSQLLLLDSVLLLGSMLLLLGAAMELELDGVLEVELEDKALRHLPV